MVSRGGANLGGIERTRFEVVVVWSRVLGVTVRWGACARGRELLRCSPGVAFRAVLVGLPLVCWLE